MVSASRIDICNQAIAMLPATQIQAIDENSLEAQQCARFYQQVIAEMLEGPHDWSFANRRVALALGTNARSSEWLYAYAVPSDMGSPIRVIPDLEGLGLGIPVALPGEPYAEAWSVQGKYFETPYILENGLIYTNVENATLEYAINDIDEASLPALVVHAIVVELASRIAVPVLKDRKLKGELLQEAEIAWARAIADDLNRSPRQSGDYLSEAMLARQGALS